MCDPEITYGLILNSPETWAFKSLPCYMSLWWPWYLADFFVFQSLLAWVWQWFQPPRSTVMAGAWNTSCWCEVLRYSLEQGAVSPPPPSVLRPSHPRAPQLEQRFQRSDTVLPRASCAWRLQPLSLSWNINAGLLFAWSSCCYGELQISLCSHRWHSWSCTFFKGNGRNAEGSADPCWKSSSSNKGRVIFHLDVKC